MDSGLADPLRSSDTAEEVGARVARGGCAWRSGSAYSVEGFPTPATAALEESVRVTVAIRFLEATGETEAVGACRGKSLATLLVSVGEEIGCLGIFLLLRELSREAYSDPS